MKMRSRHTSMSPHFRGKAHAILQRLTEELKLWPHQSLGDNSEGLATPQALADTDGCA